MLTNEDRTNHDSDAIDIFYSLWVGGWNWDFYCVTSLGLGRDGFGKFRIQEGIKGGCLVNDVRNGFYNGVQGGVKTLQV